MIEKSTLALFISILSVSIAAILIVTCNAPPLTIAFYRMLFTTLIVFSFVLIKKEYQKDVMNFSRHQFFLMGIIGIILGFHFAFWITSLKLTSIASSVILVTSHPIIVGPISHIFFNERLSKKNALGIIISLVGVILLVYGNYGFSSFSIDSIEGNILAILGGIAAGFYILGGRQLRKKIRLIPYVFVVYSMATVVLFFLCIVLQSSLILESQLDLWLIISMAVISGIFGHTLCNWALKYIRASLVSVALLGEPIASSFFAFVLPWIQQVPSYYTILGGGIILFGIYLTAEK